MTRRHRTWGGGSMIRQRQQLWIPLILFVATARLSNSFVPSYSWQQVVPRRDGATLSSKKSDKEDEAAMKRRMALVRTLQHTFYNSNATSTPLVLDHSAGIIENLPLWRVPWTELPGRCNVLNVHEAIYTNMFETILYGKEPHYVGHLHLPGGTKNLKSEKDRHRLKSWQDVAGVNDNSLEGSAVVGTLLRITDFRRMADGRLLLLVQALERFAITNAKQELPYSIADVQLLPDMEELDPDERSSDWVADSTEADARQMRMHAISESIRYYVYEFDASVRLPVPQRKELAVKDVVGSNLAKVLPFVPFSGKVDPANLRAPEKSSFGPLATSSTGLAKEMALEYRLLEGGILREPATRAEGRSCSDLSADELEIQLWICIDDYLRVSGTVIRPEMLSLLPPNKTWPKTFALEEMAKSLASTGHYFVRVSDDYPAYRRQKRLSYAASVILENTNVGDMRQMLLEVPSTQARLCTILEHFEVVTTQLLGEFL